MAIKVRIPNTGSTFTSSGSIPFSANSDIWIGFTTPMSSSGCVIFYHGAASTSGSEIFPVSLSPAQQFVFPYPINCPTGIYVAAGSGGSAIALALTGGSGLL